MSYDLHLQGALPTDAALRQHLSARPNFRVFDGFASYDHLGASFSLRWEGDPLERLSFHMNYVRPGWFSHAAEPELRALVEAFGLSVEDPQSEGMGSGPYSREGFLRGWGWGNSWATRTMASFGSVGPNTPRLPRAQNLAAYVWNAELEATRAAFEDELNPCFVPQIFLLSLPKQPATPLRAVAWTGDMALALPEVDALLLGDKMARTRDLEGLLARWPWVERPGRAPESPPLRYRALQFDAVPADLAAAVKAAAVKLPKQTTRLSPAAVLDGEDLAG